MDTNRFLIILSGVIKAAGLIVTVPATWAVASSTFAGIAAPYVHLIQIAALVLVEGVFLAGWVALETGTKAPLAIRAAYGTITLTMYAVLLAVGAAHGEGLQGALFRTALGLAVGLSIYRAGVLEVLRKERRESRGVTHSRAFKRYKRKLELEQEMERLRLETAWQAALMKREHDERMKALRPEKKLAIRSHSRNGQSAGSMHQRKSRFLELLRGNPSASMPELARRTGVSVRSAYRWKAEAE